jgi:hypothetical protein
VSLRKYKQFFDLCNSEQALAGLFHIHLAVSINRHS